MVVQLSSSVVEMGNTEIKQIQRIVLDCNRTQLYLEVKFGENLMSFFFCTFRYVIILQNGLN